MKKRMEALIFGAACLMSLITGCDKKNKVENIEDSDQEITTITFLGNKYEPENVEVIKEILSDFMEANPEIRVSYESLKGSAYYEALKKRMDSGKGDDVFMVNHDILLELVEKGQAADLSELSAVCGYSDSILSQVKDGDSIYWVPTTISAFGLYCNVDLLKSHKQKVPENIGEWREVCDYFAGQGMIPIIANNDISLKTLAIGEGFYTVYQEKRQEEVFERLNSGKEELSKYLLHGFSIVEEFLGKGYIDREKALGTQKTSDDLEEFIKGESLFMLTGVWAAGRVESMAPEFTFEVDPLPLLEDGPLLVINPDTRLSINADSQHPDAAVKFVEYFMKPENIQKFADQQASFSPIKSGAPSSVRAMQPLISCYESGRTIIGTDSLLNLPIWNLTADVSKKLLAGEALDAAMEWMDEEAEKAREELQ